MRQLFVWLLVCACVLPAASQGKRPFTFEDMMNLKRIGDPQLSPDGKWVLFSAVDVDLEANTKIPHIWGVPFGAEPEVKAPAKAAPVEAADVLTTATVAAPVPVRPAVKNKAAEERKLIGNQDSDRPRWSPDGKQFAFLSSKGGSQQIWIADFDGASGKVTAVHKLTSIATEADGELWSPDGKHILFTSNVFPDCADTACNAKKLDQQEKSKVKAQVFTRLLYRHWDKYQDGRRSHLLIVPVEGGSAHDLTPGDFDSPIFSTGGPDNYDFSPDGKEICYASNHDKVEATSTNHDLWTVSASGGDTKKITDNPAADVSPHYSPDGKYIAYLAQTRPGYESDRFRLMLYNRKNGSSRSLTEKLDQWVSDIAWAPDSSKIYFTAEDKGESPVYVVDAETKLAEGDQGADIHIAKAKTGAKTIIRGFNDDLTITRDGKYLLFTRMSVQYPTQIFRHLLLQEGEVAPTVFQSGEVCDDENGKPKAGACKTGSDPETPLTHLNDAVLSRVAMSDLEAFWFTGANEDKVQGFLLRPPAFDPHKKYPVKFLIHGGPQGAWGDDWSYRWNPELFAANGYVVVMINFHGSTGYGQKFIDAINGDWGGAPYEDLMKGLDYAEAHYGFIDKDRECALGASYGGYMANWIMGHTNRFKCIVSHDGMFNAESAWGSTEELWFNEWEFKGAPYTNRELYRKWSPHQFAANFKTPTLLIHSQKDYRLDVSEGFQLFTTLQRLNVPSKMLYFPDEGHWVLKPQNSQLWYKTVNDWVDQWTKK